MMKTSVYKIGHVYIELNKPEEMLMPENMDKFLISDSELQNVQVAMKYVLAFTENIESLCSEIYAGKIAGKEAVRNNLQVFQTKDGECRFIHFVGDERPYAIAICKNSADCENGLTNIWFRRECEHLLRYDTVFVAPLSLEKLEIAANAMILHSAYMNFKDTAVLFSAPSETGKSTQASLWEKYRGTYTVNGDRSLLIREANGWYAHGWPICGSSEICKNESYPVRAIVMLKQAKENKAYPLKGFQAFREVMEQITVNTWDCDFQIKVMDQLECLLNEVPVYRLECNISEDAVKCLEELIG